jgi:hypothetical protein
MNSQNSRKIIVACGMAAVVVAGIFALRAHHDTRLAQAPPPPATPFTEAPATVAQTPDAPGAVTQTPAAPAAIAQTPNAPGAVTQTPAAPGAVTQTPNAPAAVPPQ